MMWHAVEPGRREVGFPLMDCARLTVEGAMDEFRRITQNPLVMGGKPCRRGQRVTVGMIVGQIGAGHSIESLLVDYPYLEHEDILEALRYAAWRVQEREIDLAHASSCGSSSI